MKTTAITSIICITILAGIALFKGIDGPLLLSVAVLIAGLGGFVAGKLTKS